MYGLSRVVVWVLVVAGLVAGARAGPPQPPLLIIAIDGLEARVVEAMWAEGYLPHLASLRDRGFRARLGTADGGVERPTWTTLATGRRAADHGITKGVASRTGKEALGATTDLRRTPALWSLASEAGRRTLVTGWPVTYPAEAVNGVVLSNRAAVEVSAAAAHPPKVAAGLARWQRKADEALGSVFPGDEHAAPSDRLAVWAAERELRAAPTDLAMVYIRRVDRVSHRYWKYFEPQSYGSAREIGWEMEAKLFYEAYVSADTAVGRLVEAAGPGARVMVVSAYGFRGVPESTSIRCDLGPVLTWFGHLTWGAGEPDWRRTRLYVLDSPLSQPRKQVRVNLAGRERRGRVRPADKEALLATLREQLAQVHYQGTQTLAFRVEEPGPGDTGDLVVVFSEVGVGANLEVGDHLIEEAVTDYRLRTGSHGPTTPGLLLAAGPGLADHIHDLKATVLDITPTALHLMGLPVPEELPGRVLRQGLAPESREARHPPPPDSPE